MKRATYTLMQGLLRNALNDLSILAGNKMGPPDASWQDVAGTAALNLRGLADQLDAARQGLAESFLAFPDPEECLNAD